MTITMTVVTALASTPPRVRVRCTCAPRRAGEAWMAWVSSTFGLLLDAGDDAPHGAPDDELQDHPGEEREQQDEHDPDRHLPDAEALPPRSDGRRPGSDGVLHVLQPTDEAETPALGRGFAQRRLERCGETRRHVLGDAEIVVAQGSEHRDERERQLPDPAHEHRRATAGDHQVARLAQPQLTRDRLAERQQGAPHAGEAVVVALADPRGARHLETVVGEQHRHRQGGAPRAQLVERPLDDPDDLGVAVGGDRARHRVTPPRSRRGRRASRCPRPARSAASASARARGRRRRTPGSAGRAPPRGRWPRSDRRCRCARGRSG